MLTLLTLCALSALSCTDEELTAPRSARPVVSPNTVVTADTLCTKMQFTITSATAVTTTFPNRTTCSATGMVLIRGQAATWAQSPNRRLTLFVRLLNKSGQTLQLPIRLYLSPTGTTVVAPSGTPASKVVPLTPDSVDASGGKMWFIGGTGTLAANDSTAQDTLKFNVQSPVTQARFRFQATANTVPTGGPVPALPPDSVPTAVWQALHAPTNLEGPSQQYPAAIPRTLILVTFKENTPLANKQAAIDAIGGQVVGGNPIGNGGVYYVTIAGDGTITPLNNAISVLRTFVDVLLATPEPLPLTPGYLRPSDGPGWGPGTWRVGPSDIPDGANWALEDIGAPLAWGCSNGDSLTKIGVLDTQFDSLAEFVGVFATGSRPRFGTPGALGHGDAVASALTATGNNGVGMTGVMWRSSAFVREIVTGSGDPTLNITSGISALSQQGARVINISQWLDWELYKNQLGRNRPIASDTQHVNPILRQFVAAVRNTNSIPGVYQPLIVMIAGNKPIDAYMNGTGGLVDSFPQQVLIVGASDSLHQLYDSSGRGPRVELVAPGVSVSALDRSGAVVRATGTSIAAPLVAGVAGLLLAFDSTLTAAELKSLLINGAIRGGRTAGGIPILSAYESLKLAAQRPGAPLCGNKTWQQVDGAYVLRGQGVRERIVSASGVEQVTTYHGGKFIGISIYDIYGWHNGGWTLDTNIAPTNLGLSGSYLSSHGTSHDQDSVAYLTRAYLPDAESLYVRGTAASAVPRLLTTFLGTSAIGGAGGSVAYPPVGSEVFVGIKPGGDDTQLIEISGVNMITGVKRHLFDLTDALYPAGAGILTLGVSEDGRELVVNYATKSTPIQLCTTQFRLTSNGAQIGTPITSPCGELWGGFSTVRRAAAR